MPALLKFDRELSSIPEEIGPGEKKRVIVVAKNMGTEGVGFIGVSDVSFVEIPVKYPLIVLYEDPVGVGQSLRISLDLSTKSGPTLTHWRFLPVTGHVEDDTYVIDDTWDYPVDIISSEISWGEIALAAGLLGGIFLGGYLTGRRAR